MEKFKIELSDTITYERVVVIEVEAEDEEAAIQKALDGADDAMSNSPAVEETQVDNTTYEAEIVYTYLPHKCPSMHWNNGRDICKDCGEELNGEPT